MSISYSWEGKGRYDSFRLRMNAWVCRYNCEIPWEHMPYLSASEVMFHEEALYQVYVPLPFTYTYLWRRREATAKTLSGVQLDKCCIPISLLTPKFATQKQACSLFRKPSAKHDSRFWMDWRVRFATAAINQSLVTDPILGYVYLWSTLNIFRTGQGRRAVNLNRWHPAGFVGSILHTWRTLQQTVDHVVSRCPVIRFPGSLWCPCQADEDLILDTRSKR